MHSSHGEHYGSLIWLGVMDAAISIPGFAGLIALVYLFLLSGCTLS